MEIATIDFSEALLMLGAFMIDGSAGFLFGVFWIMRREPS